MIISIFILQMLYLDSNNLVELPDEIFTTLKNLRWLDVRNNHLMTIPSCVKGHSSLETLLLQGNNIEKLPLELGSTIYSIYRILSSRICILQFYVIYTNTLYRFGTKFEKLASSSQSAYFPAERDSGFGLLENHKFPENNVE